MEQGKNSCSSASSRESGVVSRPVPVKRNRKSRSLYGVNPSANLGPSALCQGATLTIPDPSAQVLEWTKTPISALVIKKLGDDEVMGPFIECINDLLKKNLMVYIEEGSLAEHFDSMDSEHKSKIRQFVPHKDNLVDKVDFCISLGGDGTLIHISSLFQQSVPPVLAFNMGSLGFLTPFDISQVSTSIDTALSGSAALMLRSRLKCAVLNTAQDHDLLHVKELEKPHHKHNSGLLKTFSVLNEVVVDRGPSPFLCHLELFVDNRHVTSVQGDGLIIATTTGSTAYAAAAGASMVHPSVPAIIITPICAHSLSFRPIVLPAGVEIKVMISASARASATAAFDGRNRTSMGHGEFLRITTSIYPLPSLCVDGQLQDWFSSLAECLNWNVRKSQKPLKPPMSAGSSVGSISSLTENLAKISVSEESLNGNDATILT